MTKQFAIDLYQLSRIECLNKLRNYRLRGDVHGATLVRERLVRIRSLYAERLAACN